VFYVQAGFAGNAIIGVMRMSFAIVYACWSLMELTSSISVYLVITWNHSLDVLLINLKSM